MKYFEDMTIAGCIFLVVFLVHSYSPVFTYSDPKWSIPTAMSIMKEGNVDLDEYKEIISKDDWAYEIQDGHVYNYFPLGSTLVILPMVFILDFLGYDVIENRFFLEIFFSSQIVALSAVGMYFIARLFLNRSSSLLIVFIFAFCTSVWSTASRALWSHGPSMLMLIIALYLLLLAKRKPHFSVYVSLPLFFSYVIRPTNILSIVLISLFVFLYHRQYIWRYLLWGLAVIIPFLIFTVVIYDSPFSPYYDPSRIGTNTHFFEALAGNLISPSRGLFIFSPLLLFSLYGIFLKWKQKTIEKLDGILFSIMIFHWILISSYFHWWGGHSIGPRLFTDMLPYFVYFLIPVIAHMKKIIGIQRIVFVFVFFALLFVSFFIHFHSATSIDVWLWNGDPMTLESRLWGWTDLQFLRGIGF